MTPISFPQVTKVFTAPEGVSPEDCGSLPVHDTGQALVSCWQLTEEERAEVARTGVVWLWVFGRGHPMVSVEARSPFETPEDRLLAQVAHIGRPADSEQRIRQEVERLQGEDQGHG